MPDICSEVPIAMRGFHGPVDLRLYYQKNMIWEEYEFKNSEQKKKWKARICLKRMKRQ